jgi:electron transfer flavoprotein alpha subunit
MGNVIALCEFSGTQLRSSALSNLTFARAAAAAHGGEVVALLLGAGAAAAGAHAATFAPKVVTVDDAALSPYLAEAWAPIIARLATEHGASLVTATATSLGKDVMPRTAALLDAAMASDVVELAGKTTFVRPILSGNARSTVELSTAVVAVTIRQSEFEPAAPLGAAGSVAAAAAGAVDTKGARVDRVESQKSDRPDLADASPRWCPAAAALKSSAENFKVHRVCSWPTCWARPSAHRARRSDAGYGAERTGRSARPARSSRPSCTSRPPFPVPSSI